MSQSSLRRGPIRRLLFWLRCLLIPQGTRRFDTYARGRARLHEWLHVPVARRPGTASAGPIAVRGPVQSLLFHVRCRLLPQGSRRFDLYARARDGVNRRLHVPIARAAGIPSNAPAPLRRPLQSLLFHVRCWLLPEGSPGFERYAHFRGAFARWFDGPPDARRAQMPASNPADEGQLSVVVMAMDAPASLVDAVRSLLAQVPRPEIVVVNSGTAGAARRLRNAGLDVLVVESDRRLFPGAARNLGISATQGPFVAFLAADCRAAAGWVAHRLAAHRSGATMVSTPVINDQPWNPFSTASHILLFSSRLPGTVEDKRAHYGASYSRDLFTRHGRFRTDLRTGEDTEFHARIAATAIRRFAPGARTLHRNPRGPCALLRDQFRRGRRSSLAYASLGSAITPQRNAKNAIDRVPRLVRLSLDATPGWAWAGLMLSRPVLLFGARAYARGAMSVVDRPPRRIAPPVPDAMKVVALLQIRNDRRFLADWLDNVAPHVDGIIALDDGSSDGGVDLLRQHPKVRCVLSVAQRRVHVWDEIRNRRLLIDVAGILKAEWIIAIDADERVEMSFRQRADAIIASGEAEGRLAFHVAIRELWDTPDRMRVDGVWGTKATARLFRYREDHDFGDKALHGFWAPLNSRPAGQNFPFADLILYHQRMIHAVDRERRRQRYNRLDPDRKFQSIGYDYLVDDTGILLHPFPEGRGYEPLRAAPPEPDGP